MVNILFKIPAIHCNHCSHTIKMELSELEGVGSVQVDVAKKEVALTFEPPASEQKYLVRFFGKTIIFLHWLITLLFLNP